MIKIIASNNFKGATSQSSNFPAQIDGNRQIRRWLPWRKLRIAINSETIRSLPNHSGIFIRTKQLHSDLI